MCKDIVILRHRVEEASEFKEKVAVCKECGGIRFVKNGQTGSGRQNYKCKSCGTQSDFNPDSRKPSFEIKNIIEALLKKKVTVSVLSEATGVPKGKLYSMKKTLLGQVN